MSFTPNNFGAVVLGAGSSLRMGTPKALLDLGGKPLIYRMIKTVLECPSTGSIIVVTGHEPEPIRRSLADFDVKFVHNPAHAEGGMLSSVKIGAAAAWENCDAFFLMLLDQPLIKASTLNAMTEAWNQQKPAMIVPAYRDAHGHPILIASDCVEGILSLPPSATLRDFVLHHRAQTQVVEVDDAGILSDMDTPDDYQLILDAWNQRKSRDAGKI